MKTSVNAISVKCKYQQFPWKLHEMLNAAEDEGFADIVSWSPDGDSFHVHDKDRFAQRLMSEYFKSLRYKTFQRNLNLWGFRTRTKEPRKGDIYHGNFLRGKKELCDQMVRVRVKQKNARQYLKMSHHAAVAAAATSSRSENIDRRKGTTGQATSQHQGYHMPPQLPIVSPTSSETDEVNDLNGMPFKNGSIEGVSRLQPPFSSQSQPTTMTSPTPNVCSVASKPQPCAASPLAAPSLPIHPKSPKISHHLSPSHISSRPASPSTPTPSAATSTDAVLELLNQLNLSLLSRYLEIVSPIHQAQLSATATAFNVAPAQSPIDALMATRDPSLQAINSRKRPSTNDAQSSSHSVMTQAFTAVAPKEPKVPSVCAAPRSNLMRSHSPRSSTHSPTDGGVSSQLLDGANPPKIPIGSCQLYNDAMPIGPNMTDGLSVKPSHGRRFIPPSSMRSSSNHSTNLAQSGYADMSGSSSNAALNTRANNTMPSLANGGQELQAALFKLLLGQERNGPINSNNVLPSFVSALQQALTHPRAHVPPVATQRASLTQVLESVTQLNSFLTLASSRNHLPPSTGMNVYSL